MSRYRLVYELEYNDEPATTLRGMAQLAYEGEDELADAIWSGPGQLAGEGRVVFARVEEVGAHNYTVNTVTRAEIAGVELRPWTGSAPVPRPGDAEELCGQLSTVPTTYHEQVLVLQPLGEVGRSIVEQVAAAGMAGRKVACGLDPQEVAHA